MATSGLVGFHSPPFGKDGILVSLSAVNCTARIPSRAFLSTRPPGRAATIPLKCASVCQYQAADSVASSTRQPFFISFRAGSWTLFGAALARLMYAGYSSFLVGDSRYTQSDGCRCAGRPSPSEESIPAADVLRDQRPLRPIEKRARLQQSDGRLRGWSRRLNVRPTTYVNGGSWPIVAKRCAIGESVARVAAHDPQRPLG